MMRDEDKPFICTRKGRWNLQIAPRKRAGWLWLGLWVLAFMAIAQAVVWLTVARLGESTPVAVLIAIGVALVALVWTIALVRWALPRSQIIDLGAPAKPERGQGTAKRRRSRVPPARPH